MPNRGYGAGAPLLSRHPAGPVAGMQTTSRSPGPQPSRSATNSLLRTQTNWRVPPPPLKREPSQRDVDRNTALRLDRQHTVFPRKAGGIRNTTAISGSKNRNDEIFFVPETAEKRHVDVASKARFPPSQKRQTTDDAETPLPADEETLKIPRRLQQRNHRVVSLTRTRANQACCSTSPELMR